MEIYYYYTVAEPHSTNSSTDTSTDTHPLNDLCDLMVNLISGSIDKFRKRRTDLSNKGPSDHGVVGLFFTLEAFVNTFLVVVCLINFGWCYLLCFFLFISGLKCNVWGITNVYPKHKPKRIS